MNISFTKIPALLLVIIIIISFAMISCGNSSQSAQTIIDRLANDMKSQLPKKLDKDTKLVNVYTKKLEFVSEYELLNFKSTEENKVATETKIEFYLKSQVCPNIKKDLLSKGVSSKYVYKGKDGQYLFEKVLKPGDC
jgi:hypothetical protein